MENPEILPAGCRPLSALAADIAALQSSDDEDVGRPDVSQGHKIGSDDDEDKSEDD